MFEIPCDTKILHPAQVLELVDKLDLGSSAFEA